MFFVLLLLLGGGVLWFARRQAPGIVRGPAWDCGFIAPPHHLPFGDPATQVSAAGMAQPLRRMLGKTLLAAREKVEMPPPGNTAPARLEAGFHDPVLALISGPLPRARDRLAALAERFHSHPAPTSTRPAQARRRRCLQAETSRGARAHG